MSNAFKLLALLALSAPAFAMDFSAIVIGTGKDVSRIQSECAAGGTVTLEQPWIIPEAEVGAHVLVKGHPDFRRVGLYRIFGMVNKKDPSTGIESSKILAECKRQ